MKTAFLCLLLVLFAYPKKAQTSPEANEPRDIEQIYERPSATPSWSSTFSQITSRQDSTKSIAIVIGLSDYTGDWRPLEAPWYDARRVRDALIKAGFDYVVTLTNRKATKDTITKYMEEILPKKVKQGDRFLFYFSGHGSQRNVFNGPRGYLPMINSSQEGWSTMIGMDSIEQWSNNAGQSRHSLFVIDACFSGLAGVQAKGSGLSNVYLDDLMKSGHFLITAGSKDQESVGSLQQWGGSLFTDAFLRGIAGDADSGSREFPPNGIITVTKLYDYIRSRVSSERDRIPAINQTPLLSDLTPKSLGEIFFFADAPAEVRFPTPVRGSPLPSTDPELVGSKADQLYGNGLTDWPQYQFGKTLESLTSYGWESLPVAPEFKRNEVRYLIVNVKDTAKSLAEYGCISPESYFVFFFDPRHVLFRFSIRLLDQDGCPKHDVWLSHFANSVGAPVQTIDSLKFFSASGKKVQLLGASNAVSTVVDIVLEKESSLMTTIEWLAFVQGPIKKVIF
jgi:uncharacterized caspase-like protein